MKIREAILKAADSIEQYPDLFNFSSCSVPNAECGTPGCALGWIGLHAGMAVYTKRDHTNRFMNSLDGVANLTTGDNDAFTFYSRMGKIGGPKWGHSAASCAATLRKYADKYHTDHIPSSVREIFDVRVAA